jgi:glyoxylase-like metal-dependent hydrolase (beta-lactamase superfamily II)/predicted ester cyclase
MATTEQASEAAEVARGYFGALERADRGAQREWYAPDMVGQIFGVMGPASRDEMIAYFDDLYAAIPDFAFEILDLIGEGDKAVVRWHATGTFAGPGHFQGLEPNGARLEIEGCDFVRVKDGKVARIDAYTDNATVARQLGVLPPAGSSAEQRLTKVMNARTRMAARTAGRVEDVAEGVWLLRGGFPGKTMNVYFVRDGDGVLAFDAGVRSMTNAIAREAVGLGGLTRVVLGHGHPDHRGAAPGLHVPVYVHSADRAITEGDGGMSAIDFSQLDLAGRLVMPRLLKRWDGGPVKVAGTFEEGDEIAGFKVVHLPGHSAGMCALWRESDRLALTSDCFYTLDPQTGRKGHPRVAHAAFNLDTEQARASIRKLAALEPAAAWPGHADPLTGNVREQLERAADTT